MLNDVANVMKGIELILPVVTLLEHRLRYKHLLNVGPAVRPVVEVLELDRFQS